MQGKAPAVALVTWARFPNLWRDDLLLADALDREGLRAVPCVWDDPAVDWGAMPVAVLRSTWDYHLRRDEFLAWTERAALETRLWNPPELVRWNTDKLYLKDLEAKGVPVVPTEWVTAPTDVAEIMARRGWPDVVIKPTVSGGAHQTRRYLGSASLAGANEHLASVAGNGGAMVQPYLRSVEEGAYRERSLLWIDGAFTHAVRKYSAFETHGFEPELAEAPADELALAGKVLEAVPVSAPFLYARIDLVREATGRLCLMELELTEPTLFFREGPHAARRLARAISRDVLGL